MRLFPAVLFTLITMAGAAMGKIIQEKAASMQKYPNIKPGEDFEGYK